MTPPMTTPMTAPVTRGRPPGLVTPPATYLCSQAPLHSP